MQDKARSAHDWLLSDSAVEHLMQAQARLLALQSALDDRFPELALRASQVQGDTATLLAPSAAGAAKARQSIPRLTAALQRAGWQISRLKIRPQRQYWRAQAPVFKVKPELSPVALQALTEIRESVNHPELRRAIHRMIIRHDGNGQAQTAHQSRSTNSTPKNTSATTASSLSALPAQRR